MILFWPALAITPITYAVALYLRVVKPQDPLPKLTNGPPPPIKANAVPHSPSGPDSGGGGGPPAGGIQVLSKKVIHPQLDPQGASEL